jgi:branched-chain amino acid transport system substrate-binding protein
MPRTTFSLLLVGSVAITTVAVAHNSVAEILVGYAGPLTGEMALASEGMQNGVELAIAELNAVGALLGQKVTLDLVDDYCDAEQALAAARKLLADRVAVVIGHLCSGTSIPASLLYEEARIPFISLASSPVLTSRGLRLTFRTVPPNDVNAKFTAQYMVQRLAAKRIAIIHDTHVYGKGIAELTRQSLEELGTPPVLFEALQPGQLVFADLIQRMRGAEIDVVSYGGYPPSVGLLRRQMAEASFLPTLIASTANGSEEYYLIAGEAAEGTLVVADQRFNTAEFSRFEESLRAAYHTDSDVRNTRVTPASTSGRRRSRPRARQMAWPWLKRYALGRFTSSVSKPASTTMATCRARWASPAFGSGMTAGPCRCRRILPPEVKRLPRNDAPGGARSASQARLTGA